MRCGKEFVVNVLMLATVIIAALVYYGQLKEMIVPPAPLASAP